MQFDIYRIAQVLQLKHIGKRGDEHLFICPFCSTQKEYPKLYVNSKKGTYYCQHCHSQGSITELWAWRCGVDTKEAYKQMLYYAPGQIVEQKPQEPPPPQNKNKLHDVYSEFFGFLGLDEEHREDLLRRGLPESRFKDFKSLPTDAKTRWNICSALNKKFNLTDVPGFKQKTSQKGKLYWDCISSGMLIPVRDINNKITGFQIRTSGDPKYLWFSYAGQSKSSAHIMNGKGHPWIIEGILKTYVANYFLGVPCIGIPGTNTWRTIPFDLIRGGKIIVCYDNENNPYSAEAKENLIKCLKEKGFDVIEAGWNRTLGKGIDDACLSMYKQGQKPRPELFLPGIAA